MANVSGFELEFTSLIPASKVFNDFVLGFFDFITNNIMPQEFGMKVTTVEGDGGVGSLMLMTYADETFPGAKYRVKGLDLENFFYSFAMITKTDEGECESNVSEIKVIPSTEGGCTYKHKMTYFEAKDEEDIEIEKEQLEGYFNRFEFSATQDSKDGGDL